MKLAPALLGALALCTVTLLAVASPASAACVAESITVSPPSGEPGSSVTVSGREWRTECNDTQGQEVGSSTPPSPQPASPPDTAVIIFTQNGQSQEVGTVTANSDYTFSTQVQVPSSARPGDATFTARGQSGQTVVPVAFQVTTKTAVPTDALPRTGPLHNVLLLGVAGMALIAAGAWTVMIARRRGRHAV
jgi:hypothetical protein